MFSVKDGPLKKWFVGGIGGGEEIIEIDFSNFRTFGENRAQ
jgi:hypothetical protein